MTRDKEERIHVFTIPLSRLKEIRAGTAKNDKGTFIDIRVFVTPYDAADDEDKVATRQAVRMKIEHIDNLDKMVKELKKHAAKLAKAANT